MLGGVVAAVDMVFPPIALWTCTAAHTVLLSVPGDPNLEYIAPT